LIAAFVSLLPCCIPLDGHTSQSEASKRHRNP